MIRRFIAAAVIALTAAPVAADGFVPVTDRSAFLSMVDGRELHLGRFGVNLRVQPDGTIEGRAVGWELTGSWSWQNGYFCRDMDWSGTPIPYNCQLVEAAGEQMRFTVDQGAGDSAVFRLR